MALAPLPENFRSEMARHNLKRADVCRQINMNANLLSGYLTGSRPLTGWAAHNIGYGINIAAGVLLIDVDMNRGLIITKPGRSRRTAFGRGYLANGASRRSR